MILNSFFGWYRNVNDSEANMSADVQSSQSRVAIRESCTGICDVILVVNEILRNLQDTVLSSNYSYHVSVGAHSGITINFSNVRRIRLRELSSGFFGSTRACLSRRQCAREASQLQPLFIQDTRASPSVIGSLDPGHILYVPSKQTSFHFVSAFCCPCRATSSFFVIQNTS